MSSQKRLPFVDDQKKVRERESDNVAHKSDRRLSDGENHHGGREDFRHAETRRRRDVDHFHVFPRLVDGSVESGREVSIQ